MKIDRDAHLNVDSLVDNKEFVVKCWAVLGAVASEPVVYLQLWVH